MASGEKWLGYYEVLYSKNPSFKDFSFTIYQGGEIRLFGKMAIDNNRYMLAFGRL